MRLNNSLVLAAALVSVVALTGCSDDDPGTPTGGDQGATTSPPTSAGLPHSGAPKVSDPIADTSRWEADPCNVLDTARIKSLGLTPTEPEREDASDAGTGCHWEFDPDSASGFTIRFANAGARQGISNLYQHEQQGTAAVFEELSPIEGMPAVIAMPEDTRKEGGCAVSVGLRDDLLFTADMTADPSIPQGKDSCAWAEKIARQAVQTMKGAS